MIVLYPDAERAQVITFDELRSKLVEAYAKHKENYKRKLARSEVNSEDINFLISYWVGQLPSLFTAAMDNNNDVIRISYSTYPKYYEEEHQFLVNLWRKAAPKFVKILEGMNIPLDSTNIETSNYPFMTFKIKDIKLFINSNHDVIDIEE